MDKTHLAAAIGALLLGMSTAALPQGTTGERSTAQSDRATTTRDTSGKAAERKDDGKLSRSERRMIESIARKNQAEVELAQLARSNATHDQVKQFASKMIADHQKAGDELKQVASAAGVTVPTDLDRKHKRAADNLSKAKGADFDRKFMAQMVEDHESTLKDLKKAAKDARDPQVRSFAEKTAPHVEQHLQEARQIASAVGAKGGDRTATTGAGADRTAAGSPRAGRRRAATPPPAATRTRAATSSRVACAVPLRRRAATAGTLLLQSPPYPLPGRVLGVCWPRGGVHEPQHTSHPDHPHRQPAASR